MMEMVSWKECAMLLVRTTVSVLGLATILLARASEEQPADLLMETFEDYPSLKANFGDTINYKVVNGIFGKCGKVSVADSGKTVLITKFLDADTYRGTTIILSAWANANFLTKKYATWNGVKVMLIAEDSSGAVAYPQLNWSNSLSWDWTSSSSVVSISPSLKSIKFLFGVENTKGEALFDSLKIKIMEQAIAPARDSSIPIPNYAPVRLRGAMIGTARVDSLAIAEFGNVWKGNVVRWIMNGQTVGRDSGLLAPDYESRLDREIEKLAKALPICEKHGIKVVVDLHNLSRGMFRSAKTQSMLIESWKKIVRRFHTSVAVWGWDLANEPEENEWQPGAMLWNDLADTLAQIIRQIDTAKVIIVQSTRLASPLAFSTLKPVGWKRGYDIQKVVYSFHFYDPGYVTHQGVMSEYPLGPMYPGEVMSEYWDVNKLKSYMQPVVAFQNRYRVPIFVGEFSCVRWAPGNSAYRWMKDAVSLFEEYGWDWCYHAFRESHIWSVEHSENRDDSMVRVNTNRKSFIMEVFSRNRNPYLRVIKPNKLEWSPNWNVGTTSGVIQITNAPHNHMLRVMSLDGRAPKEIRKLQNGYWEFQSGRRGIWVVQLDVQDPPDPALIVNIYD